MKSERIYLTTKSKYEGFYIGRLQIRQSRFDPQLEFDLGKIPHSQNVSLYPSALLKSNKLNSGEQPVSDWYLSSNSLCHELDTRHRSSKDGNPFAKNSEHQRGSGVMFHRKCFGFQLPEVPFPGF